MAPNSIAFVLMPGKNTILTPVSRGLLSESIGIIPIGHPAIITTEGLEWDIENWHTEMGGQVSTSNHIKKPIVDVYTTERVLFTVEIARTAS